MDEDEDAALERFMQEDALLDAIQYAPDLPGTGATVSLAQASRPAPSAHPVAAHAPGIVSLAREHGAGGQRNAEEHAKNSAALATVYHEALRHGQSGASAAVSSGARGRGAAATGGDDTSYAAAMAPRRQPLEVEAAGPARPTPRRPPVKASGVPLQAVPLAVAALMGMWFFGPSLYEEPERHPLVPAAPASPKEVKMPAATVDEEHNATVQEGSQRFSGQIGVAFSSDSDLVANASAANASTANASAAAPGAAAGNATEAIRAGRADRRRGMRMRTGAKDLT